MSQATTQWFSFGVDQAWVAAYSTTVAATWTELPVTSNATIDVAVTRAEVRDGEGDLKHVWFHTRTATLSLTMRQWGMRVLELISGNPVSSSSGYDQIDFGRDEEITPPKCRVKLKCKAVDETGTTEGAMWVYLYAVQFGFPSIGMAETAPGEVTLEGSCLVVQYDDDALLVAKETFGRIEAIPTTSA
jgi:hypothetical protein